MKNQYTSEQFKKAIKSGKIGKPPTEKQEQKNLCDYVRLKYPDAVFKSDLSGVNLSRAQRSEHKLSSSPGWPDFIIVNPSAPFSGLAIELKRTGEKLTNKQGSLKTKHLKRQLLMLEKLKSFGWATSFAIGSERAIKIVDAYFAADVVELSALCFPGLRSDILNNL